MMNKWVGVALVMLFIATVAYSEYPSLQTQPQSQIAIVVAPAPILNSASGGSTNTSDSTSACSSQQSSTNDVANRMCPQPDGVRTYYDTSRACDALYDPSRCNGQKSALEQPPTQSQLAAGAVLSACAKNKANCSCGEKQANVVVQGKCVAPNKCRATRSISQDGAECTYSSTSCSSNCAPATADGRQQYNQLSSQYAASNNPIVPIAEKPPVYTAPATPAPAPAPGTGAPKPAVVPQPAPIPGSNNIDQGFNNRPLTTNPAQTSRPEASIVTPNYVAPNNPSAAPGTQGSQLPQVAQGAGAAPVVAQPQLQAGVINKPAVLTPGNQSFASVSGQRAQGTFASGLSRQQTTFGGAISGASQSVGSGSRSSGGFNAFVSLFTSFVGGLFTSIVSNSSQSSAPAPAPPAQTVNAPPPVIINRPVVISSPQPQAPTQYLGEMQPPAGYTGVPSPSSN